MATARSSEIVEAVSSASLAEGTPLAHSDASAGGFESPRRLRVIPLTVAAANRVVEVVHRHHGPCPPALAHFTIGVLDGNRLCGAAIVGRPANRNSDDGETAEILRLASDGTANAVTFLLARCVRVSQQMGFARILTYTLEVEGGASLRAGSWDRDGDGIQSWWHRYPERNAEVRRTVVRREHHGLAKVRWLRKLRDPLGEPMDMSLLAPIDTGQMSLGAEEAA